MKRALLLASLVALAALVAPSAAQACSCAWVQAAGFLAPQDGLMPLNAQGILWGGSRKLDPAQVQVLRLTDAKGGAQPVPFTLHEVGGGVTHVRLQDKVAPGERYRFRTRAFNAFDKSLQIEVDPVTQETWQVVTFTVSPKPLLIESLKPTLEVGPVETLMLSEPMGASCAHQVLAAQSRLRVVLPAELVGFEQHLIYATLIDGKTPWSPRSSLCDFVPPGRTWTDVPGTDLVYAPCQGAPSARTAQQRLPEGAAHLVVQVLFPQVSPKAALTPKTKIELKCSSNSDKKQLEKPQNP